MTYRKFHLIIRIISAILVITFLAQDIAWANPDSFINSPARSDKLAPESSFRKEDFKDRGGAAFVKFLIERHPIFNSNIGLAAIEHILNDDKTDDKPNPVKAWLRKNGIRAETDYVKDGQPAEIRITIPAAGYILRYYDPAIILENPYRYDAVSATDPKMINSGLWMQFVKIKGRPPAPLHQQIINAEAAFPAGGRDVLTREAKTAKYFKILGYILATITGTLISLTALIACVKDELLAYSICGATSLITASILTKIIYNKLVEISLDDAAFGDHIRIDAGVRSHSHAYIRKPPLATYETGPGETKPYQLPQGHWAREMIDRAIEVLKAKAIALGDKEMLERAERLEDYTTVLVLLDAATNLIFSDIKRGVFRAVHAGRTRNALYLTMKFLDKLDPSDIWDMEDLAMLLNANQRFIDAYNKFVPVLEETRLTLDEIKKIHKRLEIEKALTINSNEKTIGSIERLNARLRALAVEDNIRVEDRHKALEEVKNKANNDAIALEERFGFPMNTEEAPAFDIKKADEFRKDYFGLFRQYWLIASKFENLGDRRAAKEYIKKAVMVIKHIQKVDSGMSLAPFQEDMVKLLLREGLYDESIKELEVYLTGKGFPRSISEDVRKVGWQNTRKIFIRNHFNSLKNRVMHTLVSHGTNASIWGRWKIYSVCRQALRLFNNFEVDIKKKKGGRITMRRKIFAAIYRFLKDERGMVEYDSAFSEDNMSLDPLIAGLGLRPDASQEDIDKVIIEAANDPRANDRLLRILGFNKKQRTSLMKDEGTLFRKAGEFEVIEDIVDVKGITEKTIEKARDKIRQSIECQRDYKHEFAKFAALSYSIAKGDTEDEVDRKINKVFLSYRPVLRDGKFLNAMSKYFERDPRIMLSLVYIVWVEIRAGPEDARKPLIDILIKLSRINRGWMLSYYKLAAIQYLDRLAVKKVVRGILAILAKRPPKDPQLRIASFQTVVGLARKGSLRNFYALVKPEVFAPLAALAVKAVAEARPGTKDLEKFLNAARRHPGAEVQKSIRAAELSEEGNLPWRTLGLIGIMITSAALYLYTGNQLFLTAAIIGMAAEFKKGGRPKKKKVRDIFWTRRAMIDANWPQTFPELERLQQDKNGYVGIWNNISAELKARIESYPGEGYEEKLDAVKSKYISEKAIKEKEWLSRLAAELYEAKCYDDLRLIGDVYEELDINMPDEVSAIIDQARNETMVMDYFRTTYGLVPLPGVYCNSRDKAEEFLKDMILSKKGESKDGYAALVKIIETYVNGPERDSRKKSRYSFNEYEQSYNVLRKLMDIALKQLADDLLGLEQLSRDSGDCYESLMCRFWNKDLGKDIMGSLGIKPYYAGSIFIVEDDVSERARARRAYDRAVKAENAKKMKKEKNAPGETHPWQYKSKRKPAGGNHPGSTPGLMIYRAAWAIRRIEWAIDWAEAFVKWVRRRPGAAASQEQPLKEPEPIAQPVDATPQMLEEQPPVIYPDSPPKDERISELVGLFIREVPYLVEYAYKAGIKHFRIGNSALLYSIRVVLGPWFRSSGVEIKDPEIDAMADGKVYIKTPDGNTVFLAQKAEKGFKWLLKDEGQVRQLIDMLLPAPAPRPQKGASITPWTGAEPALLYETGKGVIDIDGRDIDVRRYVRSKGPAPKRMAPRDALDCFRLLTAEMDKYSPNPAEDKDDYFTIAGQGKGVRRIHPRRDLDGENTSVFSLEQGVEMVLAPVINDKNSYVEIFLWKGIVIGYGLAILNENDSVSLSFRIFPPYREGGIGVNRQILYMDKMRVLYNFFDYPQLFVVPAAQLGVAGRWPISNAPIFYLKLGFVPMDATAFELVKKLAKRPKLSAGNLEEIVSAVQQSDKPRFMMLDLGTPQQPPKGDKVSTDRMTPQSNIYNSALLKDHIIVESLNPLSEDRRQVMLSVCDANGASESYRDELLQKFIKLQNEGLLIHGDIIEFLAGNLFICNNAYIATSSPEVNGTGEEQIEAFIMIAEREGVVFITDWEAIGADDLMNATPRFRGVGDQLLSYVTNKELKRTPKQVCYAFWSLTISIIRGRGFPNHELEDLPREAYADFVLLQSDKTMEIINKFASAGDKNAQEYLSSIAAVEMEKPHVTAAVTGIPFIAQPFTEATQPIPAPAIDYVKELRKRLALEAIGDVSKRDIPEKLAPAAPRLRQLTETTEGFGGQAQQPQTLFVAEDTQNALRTMQDEQTAAPAALPQIGIFLNMEKDQHERIKQGLAECPPLSHRDIGTLISAAVIAINKQLPSAQFRNEFGLCHKAGHFSRIFPFTYEAEKERRQLMFEIPYSLNPLAMDAIRSNHRYFAYYHGIGRSRFTPDPVACPEVKANLHKTGGAVTVPVSVHQYFGGFDELAFREGALHRWVMTESRDKLVKLSPEETGDILAQIAAAIVYHYEPGVEGGRTIADIDLNAGDFILGQGANAKSEEGLPNIRLITVRERKSGVDIPHLIWGLVNLQAEEEIVAEENVFSSVAESHARVMVNISNIDIAFEGIVRGLAYLYKDKNLKDFASRAKMEARRWISEFKNSELGKTYKGRIEEWEKQNTARPAGGKIEIKFGERPGEGQPDPKKLEAECETLREKLKAFSKAAKGNENVDPSDKIFMRKTYANYAYAKERITRLKATPAAQKGGYRVLVNGYGVIGSKMGKACRKCGFEVVVSDVSKEAKRMAIDDGFRSYDSAKEALALEDVDMILDCTPSGTGAKMKKLYGDRRVIYQGGERLDVADLNFQQSVSDFKEVSSKKQIRVITCNTSAICSIFIPLLSRFNGLNINLDIENVPEAAPESYRGIEHETSGRHKIRFLKLLEEGKPDLLNRISKIETVGKTNPNLKPYHFHMHHAIVNAPDLTLDEVRRLLAGQSRVVLIAPYEGEYDSEREARRIYKLTSPIAEHPMVVIAQVLPTANENEVEIVYAVPHESNVVPETIDAIHAMLAIHDKAASQELVDKILGINEIKRNIETADSQREITPPAARGQIPETVEGPAAAEPKAPAMQSPQTPTAEPTSAPAQRFIFVSEDKNDFMEIDQSGKIISFICGSERSKKDILEIWSEKETDPATIHAINLAKERIAAQAVPQQPHGNVPPEALAVVAAFGLPLYIAMPIMAVATCLYLSSQKEAIVKWLAIRSNRHKWYSPACKTLAGLTGKYLPQLPRQNLAYIFPAFAGMMIGMTIMWPEDEGKEDVSLLIRAAGDNDEMVRENALRRLDKINTPDARFYYLLDTLGYLAGILSDVDEEERRMLESKVDEILAIQGMSKDMGGMIRDAMMHANENISNGARLILRRTNIAEETKIIKEVIANLRSGSVTAKLKALTVLAGLESVDREVVPILVDAIKGRSDIRIDDKTNAGLVFAVLEKIDDPKARFFTALYKLAATSAETTADFTKVAGTNDAKLYVSYAVEVLMDISHDHLSLRKPAIKALRIFESSMTEEDIGFVSKLTKDRNNKVQLRAIRILIDLGRYTGKNQDDVARDLKDKDPQVRIYAGEILFSLGKDALPSIDGLIEALNDAEERVRELAAETLSKIGTPRAMAYHYLYNDNKPVDNDFDFWPSVGMPDVEKPEAKLEGAHRYVVEALAHPNKTIRFNAIRTLANLKMFDEAAVAGVVRCFKSRDADTFIEAAAYFSKLETYSADLINELIQYLGDGDRQINDAIIHILSGAKHPKANFYIALYNYNDLNSEKAAAIKDSSGYAIEALSHPCASIRLAAAKILKKYPPYVAKGAVGALRAGLSAKDRKLRLATINTLIYAGESPNEWIQELIDELGELDLAGANEASKTLGSLSDRRARFYHYLYAYDLSSVEFIEFIEDETRPQATARRLDGDSLLAKAAQLAGSEALAAEALKHANPNIRATAARLLPMLNVPAAVISPAIVLAMHDKNKQVRYYACEAVADIRPDIDMMLPLLRTLLQDEDNDVRLAAVDAVGSYGPQASGAVDDLIKLLTRHESSTRQRVEPALSRIGTDKAKFYCYLCRGDTQSIEEALRIEGHLSYAAEALGHSNNRLRLGALAVISRSGEGANVPAVVNQLIKTLGDDDKDVLARAARILGSLNSDKGRFYGYLLTGSRHKIEETVPGDKAIKYAIEALGNSNKTVKGSAAKVLEAKVNSSIAAIYAFFVKHEKEIASVPSIYELTVSVVSLFNAMWNTILRCKGSPDMDLAQDGLLAQPEEIDNLVTEINSKSLPLPNEIKMQLCVLLERFVKAAKDLRDCSVRLGSREIARRIIALDEAVREEFTEEKLYKLIERYLANGKVPRDEISRIVKAMRENRRELFMPERYRRLAYCNQPVDIGYGQTISQPTLVAYIISLLELADGGEVLEISSGSGWLAALIGSIIPQGRVTALEIVPDLVSTARENLARAGRQNVDVVPGDGSKIDFGRERFDRIVVSCAAPQVPQNLVDALKENGRIVVPVGEPYTAILKRGIKRNGAIEWEDIMEVQFVPLVTGKAASAEPATSSATPQEAPHKGDTAVGGQIPEYWVEQARNVTPENMAKFLGDLSADERTVRDSDAMVLIRAATPESLRGRFEAFFATGKPGKGDRVAPDNESSIARRIPIIQAHIKALEEKYRCKDDEIEILSIPHRLHSEEDIEALRKGNLNYIYRIKSNKKDIAVRLSALSHYDQGPDQERVKLVQKKFFQRGSDNNSGINPILDFGVINYFLETKMGRRTHTAVYIEMPFVNGIPMQDFLHDAKNAAFKFRFIRDILRISFEFHRRLVLIIDYKISHYLVDISNQKCPVKIIDYLDVFRSKERDHDVRWRSGAEREVDEMVALLEEVMLTGEASFYMDYLNEVEPYVRQLRAPLNEADVKEIERTYAEKIFPAIDRLIARKTSAIPEGGALQLPPRTPPKGDAAVGGEPSDYWVDRARELTPEALTKFVGDLSSDGMAVNDPRTMAPIEAAIPESLRAEFEALFATALTALQDIKKPGKRSVPRYILDRLRLIREKWSQTPPTGEKWTVTGLRKALGRDGYRFTDGQIRHSLKALNLYDAEHLNISLVHSPEPSQMPQPRYRYPDEDPYRSIAAFLRNVVLRRPEFDNTYFGVLDVIKSLKAHGDLSNEVFSGISPRNRKPCIALALGLLSDRREIISYGRRAGKMRAYRKPSPKNQTAPAASAEDVIYVYGKMVSKNMLLKAKPILEELSGLGKNIPSKYVFALEIAVFIVETLWRGEELPFRKVIAERLSMSKSTLTKYMPSALRMISEPDKERDAILNMVRSEKEPLEKREDSDLGVREGAIEAMPRDKSKPQHEVQYSEEDIRQKESDLAELEGKEGEVARFITEMKRVARSGVEPLSANTRFLDLQDRLCGLEIEFIKMKSARITNISDRMKDKIERVRNLMARLGAAFRSHVLKSRKAVPVSAPAEPQTQDENPGQIGKGARALLGTLKLSPDGKKGTVNIQETKTNRDLGVLELTQVDADPLGKITEALTTMNFEDEAYRAILLAMLKLLQNSPPSLYSFSDLRKDLFGFRSAKDNFIALHKDLLDNPIALFHEIGHLMAEKEVTPAKEKLLYLSYVKEAGGIFIRINTWDALDEVYRDIGRVKLSEHTLAFIRDECNDNEWPSDWRTNTHYLLRVLQREIFGKLDFELTRSIQTMQSPAAPLKKATRPPIPEPTPAEDGKTPLNKHQRWLIDQNGPVRFATGKPEGARVPPDRMAPKAINVLDSGGFHHGSGYIVTNEDIAALVSGLKSISTGGGFIGVGSFHNLDIALDREADSIVLVDNDPNVVEWNLKVLQLIETTNDFRDMLQRMRQLISTSAIQYFDEIISDKGCNRGYKVRIPLLWAKDENIFKRLKKLIEEGRIAVCHADLGDPRSMKVIGSFFNKIGSKVRLVYISNVEEDHLWYPGRMKAPATLTQSLRSAGVDESTVIVSSASKNSVDTLLRYFQEKGITSNEASFRVIKPGIPPIIGSEFFVDEYYGWEFVTRTIRDLEKGYFFGLATEDDLYHYYQGLPLYKEPDTSTASRSVSQGDKRDSSESAAPAARLPVSGEAEKIASGGQTPSGPLASPSGAGEEGAKDTAICWDNMKTARALGIVSRLADRLSDMNPDLDAQKLSKFRFLIMYGLGDHGRGNWKKDPSYGWAKFQALREEVKRIRMGGTPAQTPSSYIAALVVPGLMMLNQADLDRAISFLDEAYQAIRNIGLGLPYELKLLLEEPEGIAAVNPAAPQQEAPQPETLGAKLTAAQPPQTSSIKPASSPVREKMDSGNIGAIEPPQTIVAPSMPEEDKVPPKAQSDVTRRGFLKFLAAAVLPGDIIQPLLSIAEQGDSVSAEAGISPAKHLLEIFLRKRLGTIRKDYGLLTRFLEGTSEEGEIDILVRRLESSEAANAKIAGIEAASAVFGDGIGIKDKVKTHEYQQAYDDTLARLRAQPIRKRVEPLLDGCRRTMHETVSMLKYLLDQFFTEAEREELKRKVAQEKAAAVSKPEFKLPFPPTRAEPTIAPEPAMPPPQTPQQVQFESTIGAEEDVVFATIDSIDKLFKEINVRSDAAVLLSENLFIEGGDRTELDWKIKLALKPLLDSGAIAILSPEEIRKRIKKNPSKDKLAVVLSKEDSESTLIWKSEAEKELTRASVLIIDDKLTGANYLYLQGVIGLARAIMANKKWAISYYYRMLSGAAIGEDVLGLIKEDEYWNNIAFAVKAILRFKSPGRMDPEELKANIIRMETLLIAA